MINKTQQQEKEKVLELLNRDDDILSLLGIEIDRVLKGGFIDTSNIEKGDYSIAKLILFLSLKRLAEQYKPISDEINKKYKSLIKEY